MLTRVATLAAALLQAPPRSYGCRRGPRKLPCSQAVAFAILRPAESGRKSACAAKGNSLSTKTIFFSVGEPSGDLHGANLARALQNELPGVRCIGFGGPKMAAAGVALRADLTELAVMWFLHALLNLPKFWNLIREANWVFRHERPDAVVLIDYPGFNWWIARRAKAHQIPVFYYGVPQMWAWAPWRIRKMRRLVDYVLCKLPFETEWYRERGCDAQYVGHPYFDEMAEQQLDADYLRELQTDVTPLIAILPGSRRQEVSANLPTFLRTAQRVRETHPNVRFAIASFNEQQANMARELVAAQQMEIPVHCAHTGEIIRAATACLACSGSVSLELLYHRKPTVIHYRVSSIAFFVQRFFRRVRFITLVNLLAADNRYCSRGELYDARTDDVPFPEYLTSEDKSAEMSQHLVAWLEDTEAHARVQQQLDDLKRGFAEPGASLRAARVITGVCAQLAPSRRTHYRPSQAA